eukprot:5809-Heterococcus_DN1.PRE.2
MSQVATTIMTIACGIGTCTATRLHADRSILGACCVQAWLYVYLQHTTHADHFCTQQLKQSLCSAILAGYKALSTEHNQ